MDSGETFTLTKWKTYLIATGGWGAEQSVSWKVSVVGSLEMKDRVPM